MQEKKKDSVPNPTQQQQVVIEKMEEFYTSPKRQGEYFLLSGFAGTGKTFSISHFIRKIPRAKVALTAPTNKAVRVLEMMASSAGLSIETQTIHSLLGLVVQQQQDSQVLKKKRESRLKDYSLVVLDECSMVNQELWQHIENEINSSRTKIIFMGDSAQLPPVNESESPTFGVSLKAELTDIIRQENGNPIIELSAAIRDKMITGNTINVADFKRKQGDKTGVSLMDGKKFDQWLPNAFKSELYKNDPDSFRVVSWTNRQVIGFNKSIRSMILDGYPKQPFVRGERAITAGPVYEVGEKNNNKIILNSDTEGTILDCKQSTHPLYKNDEISVWETVFQPFQSNNKVVVYIADDEEKNNIINKINDLANKARNGEGPWSAYWKLKNAIADLRSCHAITVHRAQGSTFQNVFIDSQNILSNPNRQEALQCLYVAVTRAAKNVILNSPVI